MQRLTIATRASPLALWQAEHVQTLLRDAHPQLAVELLRISTRGDQVLDRSLAKIGGKGLFIKELEVALMDGRADLAVHSFKDVPMQLEPQFEIGAVLEREDPRDCLVCSRFGSLQELPAGGAVSPTGVAPSRTGGWRTGLKPAVELQSCVNCLLCWLYCPDSAVRLDGTAFAGFDYEVCKGCEICADVCPVEAIAMVEEVA